MALAVVRDLRELRELASGDERALPVLENGAPVPARHRRPVTVYDPGRAARSPKNSARNEPPARLPAAPVPAEDDATGFPLTRSGRS